MNQGANDPGVVWSHLSASLAVYREEHEDTFAPPESEEEKSLHAAMDKLARHALGLITTGVIPKLAEDELADFMAGDAVAVKVRELLAYNYVQQALEFDVGEGVIDQLAHLPRRIQLAIVAFILLQQAQPSSTAIKYLERACYLFLAGYTTEVIVMCGAVLEAAAASRLPDDLLRDAGLKPAYKKTGVFSLGQRMSYEERHPLLDERHRELFWKVVNWRNDAVHVQPDMGPDPSEPLLTTALVLGVLLPRGSL